MPAPTTPPLGLQLATTAKAARRAFDELLAAAGGSLSAWLILISVKSRDLGNQRDLAAAVGITSATLTHHLNAMEAEGLLVRRRDPDNRRIQHVTLTAAGEDLFHRLRDAALAFDRRLRNGLTEAEIDSLTVLLQRLHANVAETPPAAAAADRPRR
ncbi:MAG: winged helix-turn-helix transcriptional regulator [Actinobacteria bacterium]|nr:winged helix-turn-helix transcriptional regulator [Actinomycetota bacterium]